MTVTFIFTMPFNHDPCSFSHFKIYFMSVVCDWPYLFLIFFCSFYNFCLRFWVLSNPYAQCSTNGNNYAPHSVKKNRNEEREMNKKKKSNIHIIVKQLQLKHATDILLHIDNILFHVLPLYLSLPLWSRVCLLSQSEGNRSLVLTDFIVLWGWKFF